MAEMSLWSIARAKSAFGRISNRVPGLMAVLDAGNFATISLGEHADAPRFIRRLGHWSVAEQAEHREFLNRSIKSGMDTREFQVLRAFPGADGKLQARMTQYIGGKQVAATDCRIQDIMGCRWHQRIRRTLLGEILGDNGNAIDNDGTHADSSGPRPG